jgi:hypothetical protein
MCDRCASPDHSGTPRLKQPRRLKLWEIAETMHCSIVGTCLSHTDLLTVARRCRLEVPADTPEYDVHAYCVTHAGQEGPIARAMHKLLDQRHEGAIRKVMAFTCAERLGAAWDELRDSGRVAAGYWAVLSRADVPDELRTRLFGEVHMMSHALGRTTHVLASRTSELAARAEDLEQKLMRERARHAAALTARDAEVARLQAELASAPGAAPSPGTLAPRRPKGVDPSPARERALASARYRARAAEARVAKLEVIVERLRCERRPGASANPPCPAAEACEAVVEADRRRILYLGGRQGGIDQLRAIAERANAHLLHHDGGIEHAAARIDGMIEGCDLVICPIDCISHGACQRAKALCRKLNKQFIPLRSSGATAFARVLQTLGTRGTKQ